MSTAPTLEAAAVYTLHERLLTAEDAFDAARAAVEAAHDARVAARTARADAARAFDAADTAHLAARAAAYERLLAAEDAVAADDASDAVAAARVTVRTARADADTTAHLATAAAAYDSARSSAWKSRCGHGNPGGGRGRPPSKSPIAWRASVLASRERRRRRAGTGPSFGGPLPKPDSGRGTLRRGDNMENPSELIPLNPSPSGIRRPLMARFYFWQKVEVSEILLW